MFPLQDLVRFLLHHGVVRNDLEPLVNKNEKQHQVEYQIQANSADHPYFRFFVFKRTRGN